MSVLAACIAVIGTLGAATIAATIAVRAYRRQHDEARRQRRAEFYANAVQAVEDYMEGPYRIRRRDGTASARREITQQLSDVKSRINFYLTWMDIEADDEVRAAYAAYYRTAMSEAGPQMTAAWNRSPTTQDASVPIGAALPRVRTDAARADLTIALRQDLLSGHLVRQRSWRLRVARRAEPGS